MKKLLLVSNLIAIFFFSGLCFGENSVLKKECETKAKEASFLIKKEGSLAAFEKIADPKGPFVSEESHLFCINSETGELLAHKVKRFVGVNMHMYRSSDNGHPYTQILETAETQDKGWVTYMTHGSGPERREKPELKYMHFFKVPEEKILLCVGYWNDH
ncbi:MAG: hypothetical protein GY699_25160 [Desulfobacteraceae bacterium]|nr:hypothetical protein [Desulfobacteraceae bacterium]